NLIPSDARIAVVREREITPKRTVRAQYCKIKPLAEIRAKERGWALDVLNVVRRLRKAEFTTSEMYAFVRELEEMHPDNRHVKDKIRQQLQVLRDRGFLMQAERGVWRVK